MIYSMKWQMIISDNSDMYLKNFSLLETAEGSGRYMLSPAYDLLPVNIVMPEDSEELALALNGKKTHIRRKDFLIFAQESGITAAQAEKMIRQAVSMKEKWKALCRESLMPEEMKTQLNELIEERCRTVED